VPAFLADPSPTLILILAVAAIAAAAAWFSRRTTRLAGLAVLLFLLVGLLVLLDKLFESPREEAVRRVNLMCEAATAANPDRFIEHVSKSFSLNGANRDRLRSAGAWALVRQHGAVITASGFSRDDVEYVGDNELTVGFMSKGEAQSGLLLKYTKATFVKDPDGAWRMAGVKFFDPINTKQQDTVPGFP
jgi:hypothetical protein